MRKSILFVAAWMVLVVAAWGSPGSPVLYTVQDYGAVGDGVGKDTEAIQRAVDAAAAAGGGTVYLGPGKYLAGTIYLKSGVTLHLDANATLLGSPNREDYPVNPCAYRSYTDNYVNQALIWGEGLENIAITGRGTIDGQGGAFEGLPWLQRPYLIRFVTCRNVTVREVSMRNSAMWMQHYLACDFVTIDGINVYNHCNKNNDMIDIDCCTNVRIANCYGDSDDDALTLKSTADRPCENVVITNCILASHCNALKMGTESNGGFRNITISNCTIRPSEDFVPLGGAPEGLGGIALELVDGGVLERVSITNMTIEGVLVPIFLRLGNRARPFTEGGTKPEVGTFREVVLSNILATSSSTVGCSITGLPGHAIEDVTLDNVRVSFPGGGTLADAERAIPELPEKYPEGKMFGDLPAYGFYCRHVSGLTLRNTTVDFATPDLRPAYVFDDVRDLHLDNVNGEAMPLGAPMMVFNGVLQAMVRGCTPSATASGFIQMGEGTERVAVIGNDLRLVARPFAFAGAKQDALYSVSNGID